MERHIILPSDYTCVSCMACFNICKNHAIIVDETTEGFYFPHLNENCRQCGLCMKFCPVINFKPTKQKNTKSYYAYLSEKKKLPESSSREMVTALAEYVIKNDDKINELIKKRIKSSVFENYLRTVEKIFKRDNCRLVFVFYLLKAIGSKCRSAS